MKLKLTYIFLLWWSSYLYGTPINSLYQLLDQKSTTLQVRLSTHLQLADILRKQGNATKAASHIAMVEKQLAQHDFPHIKVHWYLAKGLLAYSQYRDEEAFVLFKEGYQLNQQYQAGFCFDFCSRLAKISPTSVAEIYIKKGLDCPLTTNKKIALQEQLGNLYTQQKKYIEALELYASNQQIAQKIKDTLLESNACLNIGSVYLIEGKWSKAANFYLKSAHLKEKVEDQQGLVDVHHNIAAVYSNQKQYDKSLEYYQKCAAYYSNNKDTTELLEVWRNIAGVYIFQKKYDQATDLLQQILVLLPQFPNPDVALNTQMNLGAVYLKKQLYPKALELFETSLQIAQHQKKHRSLVTINNFLGDVHYCLKAYEQSIVYHKAALSLSQKYNNLEEQSSALFGLYESNKHLGHSNKALNWYEQYMVVKDSLYTIATTSSISELQAKYNAQQKEQAIRQLHIENKNIALENKLKTKQLYLSLLGSALLLCIIGMLWWYRYQRQKALLHQKEIRQLLNQQEIEILNAVVEAQQKERIYLGKEVHDTLGSFLAMLRLQHEANKDLVDHPTYRKQYLLMEELLGQMATEVRSIAHQLYTGKQFSFDLRTAIEQLVKRIRNIQQLDIAFHYIGKRFELPRDLELMLYRVIQELLANILKHAQAFSATVQINQSDTEIMLMVEDDGRGFDTTTSPLGLGLRSIRERVASFAGTLQIDSYSKRGTTTVIIIPMN
ncbi:MAG: tetratricopeptide repeat protein [Aureispira sp.]